MTATSVPVRPEFKPRAARRRTGFVFAAVVVVISASAPAVAADRWDEMEYGPFLTSSVTMFGAHPEKPEGITLKGVTVRLDGGRAAVCFDTDLLRYSAGWTGGWLKLMGTPFDGTHRPPEGSRPAPVGTPVFSTNQTPGWAKSGRFDDPRESPYGPLPKDWARYEGLYVHGDHVVFAYTVGGCRVLEAPWYDAGPDGTGAFTRTFNLGPSDGPLALLVCEGNDTDPAGGAGVGEPGGADFSKPTGPAGSTIARLGGTVAGAVNPPAGATWEVRGKQLILNLPASTDESAFKLVIGPAPTAGEKIPFPFETEHSVVDVSEMTKGGPARYPQAVETKGALGTGDASAAYVVDTLTLPDDNPWKAWMRIGGFDFFEDGKSAALCTWSGDVWVVSGIDEKLESLKWKRYATGLFQPLGLKIVDGKIYVHGRDQITRLHDLNGDHEADFYENFNNDVEVTPNFHEFAFDLDTDPQGNFYFTKGAPLLGTHEWDPIGKHNGCLLRVNKDGSKLDVVATGLRAPNGASVGPNGEITCSDNQGIWTPVCRLNLVTEGGFYGAVGMHHRETPPTTYDPPICWLPFAVDNSSGGQVWVTSDRWGLPRGSLLHLSYGKCRLFHVLWERAADGTPQGGVVGFPLNFDSGVMRGRFSPADGQLYVAGLRGWQTEGVRDGCFHRVRHTGKPPRTAAALKVTPDGLDITFTQPLAKASAEDTENWSVERWDYAWTKEYGSPEFKPGKPGEQGHEDVEVKAATLSADGKTVSLKLAEMKPVMQMKVDLSVETADGTPLELEIFNTVNRVPQ